MADAIEVISGSLLIIYSIVTVIVVPRFIKHVFNVLPQYNSTGNRVAAMLKAFAVFMYGITILLSAIIRNFWFDQTRDCLQTVLLQILTWKIALLAQYLCYVAIIYQIGYPDEKFYHLKRSAYVIGILGVILTIGLLLFTAISGHPIYDKDGIFPMVCTYQVSMETTAEIALSCIFGGGIIIWDLIIAALSIYFFTDCVEEVKVDAKGDNDNKLVKARLVTAKKFKIIVIGSSVATMIWVILCLFDKINEASLFAGADYFISMISLILMTRGHETDAWFKLLCCLCISGDDVKDMNIESQSDIQIEKKPIDTTNDDTNQPNDS